MYMYVYMLHGDPVLYIHLRMECPFPSWDRHTVCMSTTLYRYMEHWPLG